VGARVAVKAGPQLRRHRSGLVEPLRRAQRDELLGRLGTEQIGKDALRVVRVVNEQQQVTQADQRVSAVPRCGQRIGPAMHIADHVHSHAHTLGKSSQVQ
jgi:hypothetical protein